MTERLLQRQEIQARERTLVGVLLTQPLLKPFDASASQAPRFVADVNVNGRNIVRDVPVKTVNGSRSYATLGQTVTLTKNALGRYEITGPGDRVIGIQKVRKFNFETGAPPTSSDSGFQTVAQPYSFYQGPTPGTPGTSRWNNGVDAYPKFQIQDAQGNPV